MNKLKVPQGYKRFDFRWTGIEPGEKIHFVRDPSITATVRFGNQVYYNGERWTISGLARHLLNKPYNVSGASFFTYNGELLSTMWERGLERIFG